MSWEDIGFIKASKNRRDILEFLSKKISTPKDISANLELHFSQVSITISELKNRNLVRCLNEDSKKGRIYTITSYGKDILNSVKKIGD